MFGLFKYTEAKLAKDIIREISKQYSSVVPSYNAETHYITGENVNIYLINLLNITKTVSSSERKTIIADFVHRCLFSDDIKVKDNLEKIFPRVKTNFSRWYLGKYNSDFPGLPAHKLNGDLSIELVVDGEKSVSYITSQQLKEEELSFDSTMKQARENLRIKVNTPFEQLSRGIYCSKVSDDHDASRILLQLHIDCLDLNGKPVVFIPTNHSLLLCGSIDKNALQEISLIAREQYKNHRPLSLQPLILENGTWENFVPEVTDDYAEVHNNIKIDNSNNYADAKDILEKINEENDVDLFVASYSLYGQEDSPQYSSTATWTETVHTWLPKVDLVSFVDPENSDEPLIGALKWGIVEENFGSLLTEVPDVLPLRYEVTDFPNKEKLISLIEQSN